MERIRGYRLTRPHCRSFHFSELFRVALQFRGPHCDQVLFHVFAGLHQVPQVHRTEPGTPWVVHFPAHLAGDEDEEIEVVKLSLAEVRRRARAGEFEDAKTLAALFFLGERGLLPDGGR